MFIVMNMKAHAGKAGIRWRQIESELKDRLGRFDLYLSTGVDKCRENILNRLAEGEREFVAAGGDGTVNMLLNILLEYTPREKWNDLKLGAIGLGSSNDFMKPFEKYGRIARLPCRIDFNCVSSHDVGIMTFKDIVRGSERHYWIINASLGVTAEANRFFNQPNFLLGIFKRTSTSLAITYAALHTLISYRAFDLAIISKMQERREISLENLGIVKNPHFSGDFCYNSPAEPCSGTFYVHLMEKKSMAVKLWALWELARPHSTQSMIECWPARELTLESEKPFAVEYDGEVIITSSVTFSIIKGAIRLCN